MNLIRDKEMMKLRIVDDAGIILLEFGFIVDEFICTFYTSDSVVISKSLDEVLYDCLQDIMSNKYYFANKLSKKNDNEIIWFSDQYCDLDNDNETDKINRLIVTKENDEFVLSIINPFLERMGIRKSGSVIAFSPAGNGAFSRNISTGSSFQDDIISVFHNIMDKKKLKNLRK